MTREEAIKTLQELWRETNDSWYEETYNMAIEALKQSPNAMQLLDDGTLKIKVANVLDIKRVMVMDDNVIYDAYYPDRPTGEWIEQYASKERTAKLAVCSECGWYDGYKAKNYNFCPSCGADMRGEEHEFSK